MYCLLADAGSVCALFVASSASFAMPGLGSELRVCFSCEGFGRGDLDLDIREKRIGDSVQAKYQQFLLLLRAKVARGWHMLSFFTPLQRQ